MAEPPERKHSLRKSQLIDFPNVAAGHEGVKSSREGDLIVKPCKNSEVAFYQQSWKPDPEPTDFAYYMPKFFGTLNLQDNPPPLPMVPQTQAAQLASAELQQRPSSPASTGSRSHGRSASRTVISHLPVDESLAPTKPPKKWEPSNGARIEPENSVVLENVASGLVKPNILDVKIGSRLWADDAPPEKRERLDKVAGETTSGSLGFRFAGMKIWAGDGAYEQSNREAMDQARAGAKTDTWGLPEPEVQDDDYAFYDRRYGRAMTTQTVKRGFEAYFFRPAATGVRRDHAIDVVERFLEDLRALETAVLGQETRMYSASLLFVYEGNGAALRESYRQENRIIREARERMEQAAKDGGDLMREEQPGKDSATPAPPSLPRIDVGASLNMPTQLVMSDEQVASDEESEDDDARLPKIQALKVIDFAHATYVPGQGPDLNFLKGLRSLIELLEVILHECSNA